ncbi:MAG: hypothetical protein A4E42_00453 [Methanoregulaceae archaeon PtaU1.Bin222]|nr:MAG: hypothetical protein A4E42_00453 [Methanoregulaceae archaeon PtaU1.Bin222]
MPNRFSVRRKQSVAAGCVFCCIAVGLLLAGGAEAAMISAQVQATGTQFMGGDSSLFWQISSSNNTDFPPLVCGQEVVRGSAVDSFLTGKGGTYQSALGVQNADLIQMQVQRDLSLNGPGAYSESLLYEGFDAGTPEGGCGGESFGSQNTVTEGNETEVIPAIDPYCSAFIVTTGLMGSGLKYQSAGGIVAGDLDLPDMVGFQFAGSGSGMGSVYAGSMSMTPVYSNQFSERVIAGGKPFTIGGKFEFTSFAKTFDSPIEEVEA